METENLEPNQASESFLLFLPEDELHEIGLLFANYLLRCKGYKTFYLGQSVPLKDVEEVFHQLNPDYLFTVVTSKPSPNKIGDFLSEIGRKFKKSKVFITGGQVKNSSLQVPKNIRLISHFDQLDTLLASTEISQ